MECGNRVKQPLWEIAQGWGHGTVLELPGLPQWPECDSVVELLPVIPSEGMGSRAGEEPLPNIFEAWFHPKPSKHKKGN